MYINSNKSKLIKDFKVFFHRVIKFPRKITTLTFQKTRLFIASRCVLSVCVCVCDCVGVLVYVYLRQ